jgi:hypothetical protein
MAPGIGGLRIAKKLFAEALLTTIVEAQIAAHARPMLQKKANHAAEVVAVGVAQDQTVDPARIDVEDIDVAQDDLRRIAESSRYWALLPARTDCRWRERPHAQASEVICLHGSRPVCSIRTNGCTALGMKAS